PLRIDVTYLIFSITTSFLGLIGNSIVLLVIMLNYQKSKKSIATHYIASLALSDLLVSLIYSPTTILQSVYRGYWIMGAFLCYFSRYSRFIAMFASMLTLTTIAFDRYQAICKPLQCTRTVVRTRKIILFIWLTSCVICSPDLFLMDYS
ncbi:uncharacterized protein TRIADDRAFT_7261, partial [Trichoplax adhaerens]